MFFKWFSWWCRVWHCQCSSWCVESRITPSGLIDPSICQLVEEFQSTCKWACPRLRLSIIWRPCYRSCARMNDIRPIIHLIILCQRVVLAHITDFQDEIIAHYTLNVWLLRILRFISDSYREVFVWNIVCMRSLVDDDVSVCRADNEAFRSQSHVWL